MRIVLFDEILEQHTVRSLKRALEARGHEVRATGKIWAGHRFPVKPDDLERIWREVRALVDLKPDAVFVFRAATLIPEMTELLKQAGILTAVWFPDDPVLYQICYRAIADAYDMLLHCGPDDVLAFYQNKHGRSGVNFPFWTDAEEFPCAYRFGGATSDLVFLGNCNDNVRGGRYDLIGSLPLRTRIYGRVAKDPYGICGGYLEGTQETAKALGRGRFGLNIPQFFNTYRGSDYDFPELAAFSHFEFPSRVIQYAAAGLPIVSIEPRGAPSTFPEIVAAKDRRELIHRIEELLNDEERLDRLARATHTRFRRSFSAAARAAFLESLLTEPERWAQANLKDRARAFAEGWNEEEKAIVERTAASLPTISAEPPSLDAQRAALRAYQPEGVRCRRILFVGGADEGPLGATTARVRALNALGHTVLHLDLRRHSDLIESVSNAGEIAGHKINTPKLMPILRRFQPQIVVVDGAGLGLSTIEEEAFPTNVLRLGVALSDMDLSPEDLDVAADFDVYATNRPTDFESLDADIRRRILPWNFGLDLGRVTQEMEPVTTVVAEVIHVGDADATEADANLLDRVQREFSLRIYGRGWRSSVAQEYSADRLPAIRRAGRIHLHFLDPNSPAAELKRGVLESIADGGVVCLPRIAGMERYFEYDSEIVGYENAEDLCARLRWLLANPAQMEALRRRALARLCRAHLCEQRWMELLTRVERDVFEETASIAPERVAQLRETLAVEQLRRKDVILSGFYGASNAGDELILRSIVEGVARHRKDVNFIIAGENPAAIERMHARQAFRRSDVEAADAYATGASAAVLGGGGLWHDYSFVRAGGNASLFTQNPISLTGFGKLPLLTRMYGRPFHVYGVGAGPLEHPEARQCLRFLAEQAKSVAVRDAASKELLEGIESWRNPVECYPDAVYALELAEAEVPREVQEIAAQFPILVVNLRPWAEAASTRFFERLAQTLERAAERLQCALVGVPMQGEPNADEAVLRRVFAMIQTSTPAWVMPWSEDWGRLYGVLRSGRMLLAMRLHACLLAHRLGVPALGLAYDPKVRRHFQEFDAEEAALPLDADADDYFERIVRAWPRAPQIVAAFAPRVRQLEERATQGLRRLAERLAETPYAPACLPLRWNPRPSEMERAAPAAIPPVPAEAIPEEKGVDLRRGEVVSGVVSKPGAKVAVKIDSHADHVTFLMTRSDPRRDEYAEYRYLMRLDKTTGHTLLLHVRSPYKNPSNAGRLAYQVLLDDEVLLEEDIASSDETNSVRVTWNPTGETAWLRVRVVARRHCEPWNWGRAARMIITQLAHRPIVHEGALRVVCTSPFARVLVKAN